MTGRIVCGVAMGALAEGVGGIDIETVRGEPREVRTPEWGEGEEEDGDEEYGEYCGLVGLAASSASAMRRISIRFIGMTMQRERQTNNKAKRKKIITKR